MPAISEKQRRFFGAVIGAKKGTISNPSAKLEAAAKSVTMDQAKDFARAVNKKKSRKLMAQSMIYP